MSKKNIFIWCCDLNKNKGEGIIANKFLKDLDKKSSYPKIGKISVKPKYIVQLKNKLPNFKVFINTKNKIPSIFQRYFDNEFRKYFKLDGIPIKYEFIRSKNPYTN